MTEIQLEATPRRGLPLRTVLLGAVVVLVVCFTIAKPQFLSFANIKQVLLAASLLAIVATAEALVVITRQIDLSVGSMVGLVAYITAATLRGVPGLPVPLVVLLGVLIGAVLGAINGALVLIGRVPAIIATLATLAVYRGILFLFSGGGAITANQVPANWLKLASKSILGLPLIVVVAALVCLVGSLWLRFQRSGRLLYAIGANSKAANAVGLRVWTGSFMAFLIAGALCGLAGVGWSSLYGTIDSTAATGFELQALAAVVIGGVAVTGGRGAIWGACAGAVFIMIITNFLALLRVNSLWSQAIYGFVILVAVSVDGLSRVLGRQATGKG